MDLDTLKFEKASWEGWEGDNSRNAYYSTTFDAIGLVDDNPKTVAHELCERDMFDILGGSHFIQNTTVTHIMSPFKGGRWGRWRTWGKKP